MDWDDEEEPRDMDWDDDEEPRPSDDTDYGAILASMFVAAAGAASRWLEDLDLGDQDQEE